MRRHGCSHCCLKKFSQAVNVRSQEFFARLSDKPLSTAVKAHRAINSRLASLLQFCSSRESLAISHHHIIKDGDAGYAILGNVLLELYCKYGSLQEVCSVFNLLQQKNVFCWTALIEVHAQRGQEKDSLVFYQRMLQEGVKPDKVLFLCVLGVCSKLKDLVCGVKVHADITRADLDVNIVIRTALVNMYGKCGSLEDALLVYNESAEKDVILYNAIMTACYHHGHAGLTLHMHEQMQVEGLMSNESTLVTVLSACGSLARLMCVKMLHVCLIHCDYGSNTLAGTALINAYNKCGSLENANKVFKNISERDTVLWNTMIMAFTQHGQDNNALGLFKQMQQQGFRPSQVTFVCSLCAVKEPSLTAQGKEIHAQVIEHGFELNAFVVTALISMYGRCGSLEDAQEVFNKVSLQTVVSWTAVIGAFAQGGHSEEAFQLHQQMLTEGVHSDKCTFLTLVAACSSLAALVEGKRIHAKIVFSGFGCDGELQASLISMYSKCGSVKAAFLVFDRKHAQHVGLWNAMLAAYIQHGHATEAMQLYRCMEKKGIKPDKVTFSTTLSACSALTDLPQGKEVHASVKSVGLQSDVIVGTALVNMYAKCGSLSDAHEVFDQLHNRNSISWNALIVGYAQNGQAKESITLFEKMQLEGFNANEVTFTNVLYACSHAGLVEDALRFFRIMEEESEVKPSIEHYACIIDLLGRVGRLDDAESFIKKNTYEVDAVMWMSLLGACRVHGDIGRGSNAADSILQLNPEKTGSYVLMSNIFAAEGSQTI